MVGWSANSAQRCVQSLKDQLGKIEAKELEQAQLDEVLNEKAAQWDAHQAKEQDYARRAPKAVLFVVLFILLFIAWLVIGAPGEGDTGASTVDTIYIIFGLLSLMAAQQ